MDSHEYIAIIDMDEVIVPKKHRNLVEMLDDLNADEYHGFIFGWAWYPKAEDLDPRNEKAPEYIDMLHRLNRAPPRNTKQIVKTNGATYIHNHSPLGCVPHGGGCKMNFVPVEVALCQHYNNHWTECGKNAECDANAQFVRDDAIMKYQDELIINVQKVLRDIGY